MDSGQGAMRHCPPYAYPTDLQRSPSWIRCGAGGHADTDLSPHV